MRGDGVGPHAHAGHRPHSVTLVSGPVDDLWRALGPDEDLLSVLAQPPAAGETARVAGGPAVTNCVVVVSPESRVVVGAKVGKSQLGTPRVARPGEWPEVQMVVRCVLLSEAGFASSESWCHRPAREPQNRPKSERAAPTSGP